MNKWRWIVGFPDHLRSYADRLLETDALIERHWEILEGKSDEKVIVEEDTVFLKAAIVLVCAIWEAYVEDLLTKSAKELISSAQDWSDLPQPLKDLTRKSIGKAKDWKTYMISSVELEVARNHSPKTSRVDKLYKKFFGVEISKSWHWEFQKGSESIVFDVSNNRGFIDGLVDARNAIAHGRSPINFIGSFYLSQTAVRLCKISSIMSNQMSQFIKSSTSVSPWMEVKFNPDWTLFCRKI